MVTQLSTQDSQEWHALAHLRTWCHDSNSCPICRTERAGYERGKADAIRTMAEGAPARPAGPRPRFPVRD